MNEQQTDWYRSRVDVWIALLLCLPPVSGVLVSVGSALSGDWAGMIVGMGLSLFVAALYLGLVFPMHYGITDTHLVVRCGVCRAHVSLEEIFEVTPTRNPLSAPALSLDRLRVRFGQGLGKTVLISPTDRDRFLDQLAAQAGLQRAGDQLLRRPPSAPDVA